jgi:hypothetical protein
MEGVTAVRRQRIDVRVETAADPATVYALLRDGASWPSWSPLGSFELERPGAEEKEGLGAIRVFRTGRITSREEIVELDRDRCFGYVLRSGLAVRDYRAQVCLDGVDGVDGRTAIHWHASFRSKVPGLGGLYRMTLRRFIRQCAEGLAARAEQR